jgi:hypothetical protein
VYQIEAHAEDAAIGIGATLGAHVAHTTSSNAQLLEQFPAQCIDILFASFALASGELPLEFVSRSLFALANQYLIAAHKNSYGYRDFDE